MKFKNTIYVVCMIVFLVLAFLFFDRGFNVKTRKYVNYQEKSDVAYRVYLKENDIYSKKYLNMGERYIANIVDYINFELRYDSLYSTNVNGYYKYETNATIYIFEDDSKESIFHEDYIVNDSKVVVLNQNDLREIKILDDVKINYDYYKNIYNKVVMNYKNSVKGNLEVKFIVSLNLEFPGMDNTIYDEKIIKATIPLNGESFRIILDGNYNDIDDYSQYDELDDVNYFLIVIAAFNLSISIAFLALIIRAFVLIYERKSKYELELSKIFSEYDDIIVKVNRFYNKKKYNLIYVDSFNELIDVYNKVGNPISYREIRRGYQAIFLIIDDDNAWIYRMKLK